MKAINIMSIIKTQQITYAKIWLFCISLFLAACGSGGGSLTQDGDNVLGNPEPPAPPPDPVYAVNVELLDSTGAVNPSTVVSQDQPGTLRATVTLDGQPLPYRLVTFTTTVTGILNPTLGTAQTNANGVASVTLLPGTQAGAGTAMARYVLDDGNAVEDTLTFTSAGDAPSSDGTSGVKISLSLKNGTTNMPTTTISAANPGVIEATIANFNGEPVANRVVSFTSSLGQFRPTSGTALTDENGFASIILTAGSVEGAAEVAASFEETESIIGFYSMGDEVDPNLVTADVIFTLYDCPAGWDRVIRDVSLCSETSNISSDNPGILHIQAYKSGSTVPLTSTLVTATSTLGRISPDTGTAITDQNGVALLDLLAGSDVGAGEVEVTVITTVARKAFEIGAAEVTISVDNGLAEGQSLSAGATTVITVTIFDTDGELYIPPLNVQFTSNCAVSVPPRAVLDANVTSVGGIATATYRADGCAPEDTVTVTAITGGDAITDTVVVPVSEAQIGSIEFVDVSSNYITLSGAGGQGRTETSTVQFRVLDENGNPATQKQVTFELTNEIGGITISPTTAQSNNEGLVQTVVRSGSMPGSVRVLAYITPSDSDPNANDNRISAVSDLMTISTGLPDNNSFSLSSSILNVEGLFNDGETTEVIAHLADHFNNPVPDGTAVYFTTEGGGIQSSCFTENGICNVEWRSQDPRPFIDPGYNNRVTNPDLCDPYFTIAAPCSMGIIDQNGELIRPLGGRFTVHAQAIGEESFTDLNSNGVFDAGEYYVGYDLSESFIDHNENGVYDGISCADPSDPCSPANSDGGEFEEFWDWDLDGTFSGPDGIYNGYLCTAAAQASGHCRWESLHVRRNMTMIMSGSQAYMRVVRQRPEGETCDPVVRSDAGGTQYRVLNLEDSHLTTECDLNSIDLSVISDANDQDIGEVNVDLILRFSDLFNNPMPAGTEVILNSNNGELSGTTAMTVGSSSSTVPMSLAFTVTREGEGNRRNVGALTIEIITPSGHVSTLSVEIFDDR